VVGGDPYSVAVSSVTLFLAESAFAWLFFLGAAVAVRTLARSLGRVGRMNWPALTDASLARFFAAQLVLVASWSVLFKIVLYSTVRGSSRALNGGYGPAFWYANGAEVVIIALVLAGLYKWMKRGAL
jgi:hypothetical protein